MKDYKSVREFSVLWNLTERTVRKYCGQGKIADVKTVGNKYYIPCTTLPPMRKNAKKISTNNLLNILKYEKDNKIKGGIYHKIQVVFTYNSNHIEGSTLTEEQTRHIFETATLGKTSGVKVNDIIESTNHFKCIDFVIDNAGKPLTEKMIKELHKLLKMNTTDSSQKWFRVGDYKLRPNEVGGNATTPPGKVATEMKKLLDNYNTNVGNFDQYKSFDTNKQNDNMLNGGSFDANKRLTDIIDFHQRFETIHPFQDGNGRVGRLIMLKECLANNITPFIITDDTKLYYYRGLREWKNDREFLLETCKSCQDIMAEWLTYFNISTPSPQ
ncbi:MAG: Fic family protein [Christensenellaceae bacterium]|jgi:Fic family protein|nr:Fic family protein [Christensenellaceae bacterium]